MQLRSISLFFSELFICFQYFVDYKLGTAVVDASVYTTNFLPYLGYASQVPNVLFNWINIFVQMGYV